MRCRKPSSCDHPYRQVGALAGPIQSRRVSECVTDVLCHCVWTIRLISATLATVRHAHGPVASRIGDASMPARCHATRASPALHALSQCLAPALGSMLPRTCHARRELSFDVTPSVVTRCSVAATAARSGATRCRLANPVMELVELVVVMVVPPVASAPSLVVSHDPAVTHAMPATVTQVCSGQCGCS